MNRLLAASALALALGAPAGAHANDTAALMTAWQALNEDCRGGSGDDPQTLKACDRRTVVSNALRSHGCVLLADAWTCTRR